MAAAMLCGPRLAEVTGFGTIALMRARASGWMDGLAVQADGVELHPPAANGVGLLTQVAK
jgi:hypothetical protein